MRGSIGGRRLLGTRPWAMAPLLAGRAGTPSRRHRPSALVPAAAVTKGMRAGGRATRRIRCHWAKVVTAGTVDMVQGLGATWACSKRACSGTPVTTRGIMATMVMQQPQAMAMATCWVQAGTCLQGCGRGREVMVVMACRSFTHKHPMCCRLATGVPRLATAV